MPRGLVVSGAGGALGSALVTHFVSEERVVVAAGRGLEQAALDAKHGAGRTLAAPMELGSKAAWQELAQRLQTFDIIVENAVLAAGGWRGGSPLQETSEETWSAMLGGNLETTRVTLQALLPGMVARGGGSVVVLGASASVRPWTSAGEAAYAAAKAGVLGLVQATAAECLPRGVRLNVVMPSTIDTAANRASMPDADFSKWVRPESLARVIAFLLSDAAADVSGAAVPVYGRVKV